MNNEILLKDPTNTADLFDIPKINIEWSKAISKMLSKHNKQFFS